MLAGFIWTFDKKSNSTKRPNETDGTLINFVLKDNVSISKPVIELNINVNHSWNYLYINDFQKYYHIVDKVWARGVWLFYCVEDVLATYRTDIGNLTEYVLRASNIDAFNQRVPDHSYTALTYWQDDATNLDPVIRSAFPFATTVDDYTVVMTVSTYAHGLRYYIVDYDEFRNFVYHLTTINISRPQDWPDDFAKELLNPISNILSVRAYPFRNNVPGFASLFVVRGVEQVWLGAWDTGYQMAYMDEPYNFGNFTGAFQFPIHPLSATVGEWVNSGATARSMRLDPWGTFALDPVSTARIAGQSVYLMFDFDWASGMSSIEIRRERALSATPEYPIFHEVVPFGVDLPITQVEGLGVYVASHAIKKAGGVVEDVAKAVLDPAGRQYGTTKVTGPGGQTIEVTKHTLAETSVATGSIESVAQNISAIAQAAALGATVGSFGLDTKTQSVGNTGSWLGYQIDPDNDTAVRAIYSRFQWIADTSPPKYGRPVCQSLLLSTIPGFIQCGTATFEKGTSEEQQAVNNLIKSGFYYE